MTNRIVEISERTARIIAGMLKGYSDLLDSLEPPTDGEISGDMLALCLDEEASQARNIRGELLSCVNAKRRGDIDKHR